MDWSTLQAMSYWGSGVALVLAIFGVHNALGALALIKEIRTELAADVSREQKLANLGAECDRVRMSMQTWDGWSTPEAPRFVKVPLLEGEDALIALPVVRIVRGPLIRFEGQRAVHHAMLTTVGGLQFAVAWEFEEAVERLRAAIQEAKGQ